MLATSNEVSQSQPQPSVAGCAAGAAAAPVAAAAAAASSERALPEWLRSRRVGHLSHVFYVPDYIDEDQESRLLQRISSSAGKWTQVSEPATGAHAALFRSFVSFEILPVLRSFMTITAPSPVPRPIRRQVSGRRLQQHGGVVGKQGLIAAPLPDWLSTVASRLHRETQARE